MGAAVLLIALLSVASVDDPGLSGTVLAPDGTSVSGGRVIVVRGPSNRTTATIDRSGHFKLALEAEGPHQLWIVVPGMAPYRFNLIVPASRTVKLPPIRLSPPTYFRARFVTADGIAITSPMLRHVSLDANGLAIAVPEDQWSVQADADGAVTIGPLPRGITMMAVDMPQFAQTRLSDLTVTGKEDVIDGGVIAIQRGAVLQADIVDETGAPVAAHNVFLEDAAPRSLLSFPAVKTNAQGRATFERLAAGRYRVSTLTKEGCGGRSLLIARLVSVGGGEVHARLVIGGVANFQFLSPLGPVMGRPVSAATDAGSSAPPWQWAIQTPSSSSRRVVMPFPSTTPCSASTDADGRVTFKNFPPGTANVQLRLLNSTYVRRLPVPEGGREVALTIPDGLVSVHVANQGTNQPIANAKVVWTGNEGRVEASTNGVGDALIEAAGTNGGRLSVSAENFETLEANFSELPPSTQEVLLPPLPPSRVQLTVAGVDGAPLPNAVVEFVPFDPIDVSDFAVTDPKGIVTFLDLPRGPLRFLATAEGYRPAEVRIAEDTRGSTTLTLKRVIE